MMCSKEKFKSLFWNYELATRENSKARITLGINNTLILVKGNMIHGALPMDHEYSLPHLYGCGQQKFGSVWIDPKCFGE